MPSSVVAQYAKAINEALTMPDVTKKLADLGLEATGGSSEKFAETIASERKRWEPLAPEAGIKLN
jgi:tripartite-type tricarboxylate transporter receptor subunit TctC